MNEQVWIENLKKCYSKYLGTSLSPIFEWSTRSRVWTWWPRSNPGKGPLDQRIRILSTSLSRSPSSITTRNTLYPFQLNVSFDTLFCTRSNWEPFFLFKASYFLNFSSWLFLSCPVEDLPQFYEISNQTNNLVQFQTILSPIQYLTWNNFSITNQSCTI